MSEKPVSQITRLAVQQLLKSHAEELGRLVDAAAQSEGVPLNGQTRLDLQRFVWLIPESSSG